MNPAEDLGEIEVEAVEEPEEKEITICARLVLTKEQIFSLTHKSTVNSIWNQTMEESFGNISISAAQFSEKELEELKTLPKEGDVQPKLRLTSKQESDLLEAFNSLDYSGEGKIKGEDFRVAIKALGYEPTKEELQHMVSAVDKGNTGKLNFEAFQTAIMRKIMALDTDGDIMKSFRLFDMDDAGQISFENVKRVTEILGTYLTDEEIEEMIDDADKDGDGFINVQEFMKMIKNSVKIVTP